MAALGLITSVLSAVAADVPITAVPYTIKAAGTYILLSDLTCSDPSTPAITIETTNLTGSVVLNLKGPAIQCAGSASSTGVYVAGEGPAYNAFPVTVRNGIIKTFSMVYLPDM
jgi:hypothetical protein